MMSRYRGTLGVCVACLLPCAAQSASPGAVDYAVRLQSSLQSDSNPSLASDGTQGIRRSSLWVNTAGAAARIPLLSDDTRLDIAGTAGVARFGQQSQLDYQPRRFDSTLHWRAGRLFVGQIGYQYEHERYASDRIFPAGDTVTTRGLDGVLGMRVSEALTLPQIRVFQQRTRYGAVENQRIFDQNDRGFELTAEYRSPTGSSLSGGLQQTSSTFPLRGGPDTAGLADKYIDREWFVRSTWRYSVKTALSGRLGWLNRSYPDGTQSDVHLLTADLSADWQMSPKTQVRLGVWQHPYINDNQPAALYSTLRGGGVAINWQMSPKTALGLQGSYETLRDRIAGQADQLSTRTQYGMRFTWQAWKGGALVLDGYRSQERGDESWNRYRQNVVRVGIVVYLDSGNAAVREMLVPRKCQWSYVEDSLCR